MNELPKFIPEKYDYAHWQAKLRNFCTEMNNQRVLIVSGCGNVSELSGEIFKIIEKNDSTLPAIAFEFKMPDIKEPVEIYSITESFKRLKKNRPRKEKSQHDRNRDRYHRKSKW